VRPTSDTHRAYSALNSRGGDSDLGYYLTSWLTSQTRDVVGRPIIVLEVVYPRTLLIHHPAPTYIKLRLQLGLSYVVPRQFEGSHSGGAWPLQLVISLASRSGLTAFSAWSCVPAIVNQGFCPLGYHNSYWAYS
jgi:hypothetical protein